jgi:heat shock protein HslJ
MKMVWRTAALAGALALAAAACGPATGGEPLEGTRWTLTSMNSEAPVAGSTITAEFGADGKLGGSSGCNSYSAAYQVSGSSLTIDEAVSTLMACEEPLMTQESDYFAALSSVAEYAFVGDVLTLRDASGATVLVFAAASNDLAGTSWIVTGYNNGQGGVVSVIGGTELTAVFGADGNLSGTAGCNSYNAAYTTDGQAIHIGPAATTRMYCGEPQGVMDQEAQYLAALGSAATYSMSGSQLDLRTAGGALAASLQQSIP